MYVSPAIVKLTVAPATPVPLMLVSWLVTLLIVGILIVSPDTTLKITSFTVLSGSVIEEIKVLA